MTDDPGAAQAAKQDRPGALQPRQEEGTAIMTQTCSTCHGTGTVQKPIYNTATSTWTTVTETCLDCQA